MSLRRAHSLALQAEFATQKAHDTGSEKQLQTARRLHTAASIEFEKAGDMRQARYHLLKAKELGTRENPVAFGLSGTDILLFAGGAAAVGLVGYLVWKSQQASQAAAAAPALYASTSPTISVAATDLNPAPVPVPLPSLPPTSGGPPQLVPPS